MERLLGRVVIVSTGWHNFAAPPTIWFFSTGERGRAAHCLSCLRRRHLRSFSWKILVKFRSNWPESIIVVDGARERFRLF